MKIFLIGDSYSGTGPANVTKYYIENLPKGTRYQKFKSKLLRVPEIIIKIMASDVVIFSGYSRQNLLGLKIAKSLNKKTAYIMHGCVEYENEINHEEDEEMCRVERRTLADTDLILAVSESFANWLEDYYPEHKDKIDYVENAIDEALIERAKCASLVSKDKHMIFTVGGGMPRKKIVYICKAVEILRQQYDDKLRLVVVGNIGADSDEISKYPFVDNLGLVPFNKTVECYEKAAVFVQNSCFETFGLAFIEALSVGCSTLTSKEVGALSLVSEVRDKDVITHFDDPQEIADKIKVLINEPNATYLKERIDWESNTWKERSKQLVAKMEQLIS